MKIYNKKDLQRRIGNIYQLGGTRHYELTEGSSKGTRGIDVTTGTGFNFTVIPDRGLDISLASYKGVNLVYQTPNGEVNPAFYQPCGNEWLRTFFGGLLTTCGLTYLGSPGIDLNEELGLHGRYSNTPAKHVCDTSGWSGDEYLINISGEVEESVLFGSKIRMMRTIESRIGSKSLIVKDAVENYGSSAQPFTILYHINIGYPLLDKNSRFIVSSKEIQPYKDSYKKDDYDCFSDPIANFQEQAFLHTMVKDSDGYAYSAVINRELINGLGLYIKFKMDALSYLTQWKMMGEVDYVLGIEPSNIKCENRGVLREKGVLPYIESGEVKELEVEIGILEGEEELKGFENRLTSLF